MKHRLSAILLVPCLLITLLAPIFDTATASALSPQQIKTNGDNECNNDLAGGVDASSSPYCIDGYLAGYNGQNAPAGCANGTGGDGLGDGSSACEIGYIQGVKDANKGKPSGTGSTPSPPNVNSGLKIKAGSYCEFNSSAGYSGSNLNDCAAGYEWGFLGKSQPSVCSFACSTGYTEGDSLYKSLPPECQNWTLSAYPLLATQACQKGVSSKNAGTPDPCKSLSNSRNEKSACEQGYDQATVTASQPNGTSGSPPTCDASGFSLSWIFCPIINGLASAVDSIYTGLVQPLLQTAPIELSNPSNDPTHTYEIWSNFRIYGDIFLVIAVLVVVFGESIGGGLIDAYSAKKILPRLLVAAVLINISIYLIAFAVDITNILGASLGALIQAPFQQGACSAAQNISLGSGHSCFALKINGSTGDIGMAAMVAGGIWAYTAFAPLLYFLFVFFLIPAFLTMLAILVTVLLRRGLIIFLIMVAPVAFALYCLPNTEKYFKQWWDLLLRTLLIYPLIAVIFAMGNVLSVTIDSTSGGATKTFADFLAIAALFVPLFLIPYSFRIAGGVIGRFHEVATNARQKGHQFIKGNENDPWSRQRRARYGMGDRNTRSRERAVRWGMADNGASFGRSRRTVSRLLNTGNLQATRSRYNRERAEVLQSQSNTGDDSNQRDLFIAWDGEANGGNGGWFRRMDMENGRAVAGARTVYNDHAVGQLAHRKALSLYGGDKSSVQEALFYEWKKTGFDEGQMGRIENQYQDILGDVGLNNNEGGEMMTGVGFRHQGQSLVGKYSRFGQDPRTGQWDWSRDYLGLTKEAAHNIDTYGWSKQDVKTYDAMGDGYEAMGSALEGVPEAADDHVFEAGHQFAGRTAGQLRLARGQLESIATNVNPEQPQPLGAGTQVADLPQEEGEGGAGPQLAGLRGVSNAPAAVQDAASRFYARVHGNGGRGNGGGNGGGDDEGLVRL